MALRNACFISYRHGREELLKTFINDFHNALAAELEPLLGNDVISIDKGRLSGGAFYNETLAREVCESACMVVIYAPTYFNSQNRFCTREFVAMEQLEATRLARLPARLRDDSLIIPVVLRGFQQLPETIGKRRLCYNFESYSLGEKKLTRHPRFKPHVRELATYLHERFQALKTFAGPSFRCNSFQLPADRDPAVEILLNDDYPDLPGRRTRREGAR